ncbi:MAG: hypothetical protein Q7J32_19375, partial [Sphingomonadaceae bacterium]|nr:hypothetical protein [Sphingomonadaceae bacterium]
MTKSALKIAPAFVLRAAALSAVALLAACSTGGGGSRADVTRFHLGAPVARSTVFVTPVNAADASSLEFRTYATVVTERLRQAGFTPAPSLDQSEVVAVFGAQQTSREALSGG